MLPISVHGPTIDQSMQEKTLNLSLIFLQSHPIFKLLILLSKCPLSSYSSLFPLSLISQAAVIPYLKSYT
jgi:hypothetical protein